VYAVSLVLLIANYKTATVTHFEAVAKYFVGIYHTPRVPQQQQQQLQIMPQEFHFLSEIFPVHQLVS